MFSRRKTSGGFVQVIAIDSTPTHTVINHSRCGGIIYSARGCCFKVEVGLGLKLNWHNSISLRFQEDTRATGRARNLKKGLSAWQKNFIVVDAP
jgi:hypothetical protein